MRMRLSWLTVCFNPSYVFAAGNPFRVIRELNDRDKEYYFRDMRADQVKW